MNGSPIAAAINALFSVTKSSDVDPRGIALAYGLPAAFLRNAGSSFSPTYGGKVTPAVFGPAGSGSMPSLWSSKSLT